MDTEVDSVIGIWNSACRHIAAIDSEAHRLFGQAPPGAIEHPDSLGAVYARLAYLHSRAFDRFVLDGPDGIERRGLGRAYADYDELVRDLVRGVRSLPSLSVTPG
ncbi:hypothetical protein [Nocardia noduli]|uniref:hypothetical protein n=1 Tax=Nocardia noduli TaxID=2815722 RepID=UPI001C232315|nr:hypothetical protein [Nocardia noduli]